MENNNFNKGMINPIVFEAVDPEIIKLGGKSPEEKLYIVLYTRTDEDSNGFLICEGRMDCYQSIDRLLNTYPVDIHNSVVLVEVPAVNKNGKGEWMLKHPSNASSIYQFCKAVEKFFPNMDFNIENFNDRAIEDDNQPVTEDDIRASIRQADVSSVSKEDKEVMKAYTDMMKGEADHPIS